MHRNCWKSHWKHLAGVQRTTHHVNSTDAGRRRKDARHDGRERTQGAQRESRPPPARIDISALLRGGSLACDPRFFSLSERHYIIFLAGVNRCMRSRRAAAAQVLAGKGVTAVRDLCALSGENNRQIVHKMGKCSKSFARNEL